MGRSKTAVNHAAIVVESAIPRIVSLLGASNGEVQLFTTRVLIDLLSMPMLLDAIVAAGAIPRLVGIMLAMDSFTSMQVVHDAICVDGTPVCDLGTQCIPKNPTPLRRAAREALERLARHGRATCAAIEAAAAGRLASRFAEHQQTVCV